jgi:hypothetical protein
MTTTRRDLLAAILRDTLLDESLHRFLMIFARRQHDTECMSLAAQYHDANIGA